MWLVAEIKVGERGDEDIVSCVSLSGVPYFEVALDEDGVDNIDEELVMADDVLFTSTRELVFFGIIVQT